MNMAYFTAYLSLTIGASLSMSRASNYRETSNQNIILVFFDNLTNYANLKRMYVQK